ncbi:MAG TPA: hypothetical protein VN748_08735 [Pseudonocardiaceae bacterium]|nr:hypothetical protein [Pseudonocardiaceae bacterium]
MSSTATHAGQGGPGGVANAAGITSCPHNARYRPDRPALHLIAASAELGGGLTRVDFTRMIRLFDTDAFRIEPSTTSIW